MWTVAAQISEMIGADTSVWSCRLFFGVPQAPITFQCPFAALTRDLSKVRKSPRESLRVVPVTAVRRLRSKRTGDLPEPWPAPTTGAAKGPHSGPNARVQRKRISMGHKTVQKLSLAPTTTMMRTMVMMMMMMMMMTTVVAMTR